MYNNKYRWYHKINDKTDNAKILFIAIFSNIILRLASFATTVAKGSICQIKKVDKND